MTCQGGVEADEQAGGEADGQGGEDIREQGAAHFAGEAENQGTCQIKEVVDGGQGGSRFKINGDGTDIDLHADNIEFVAGFSSGVGKMLSV